MSALTARIWCFFTNALNICMREGWSCWCALSLFLCPNRVALAGRQGFISVGHCGPGAAAQRGPSVPPGQNTCDSPPAQWVGANPPAGNSPLPWVRNIPHYRPLSPPLQSQPGLPQRRATNLPITVYLRELLQYGCFFKQADLGCTPTIKSW